MHLPKVAILASGGGTTSDSFIRDIQENKINAEVVLVIANHENAGVFEKIKKLNNQFGLNIKVKYISSKTNPAKDNEFLKKGYQTESEQTAILNELKNNNVDIVFLLGYMKRVGKKIVDEYGWNNSFEKPEQASMLNTHPGLLPETAGLFGINVQKKVIENKLKRAGHCIFMVDYEYDDGPIISQHEVELDLSQTPAELFNKVQASEKYWLAGDINNFLSAKYNF